MEVFVKIIAEDLKSGECKIAATALLTFVALDQDKRPTRVPTVKPETEEEMKLHETAPERARIRNQKRQISKDIAAFLTIKSPIVLHMT
jgi:acyl-CoA hydrolase